MAVLSPRRIPSPRDGTDVSNGKFKPTTNRGFRKSMDDSADRDGPKTGESKSKFTPKAFSASGKYSKSEVPRAKTQYRKQSSDTNNIGEISEKKRQLRTRSDGHMSNGESNLRTENKRQLRTQSEGMRSSGESNLRTENKTQQWANSEGKRSRGGLNLRKEKPLWVKAIEKRKAPEESAVVGKAGKSREIKEDSTESSIGEPRKRWGKKVRLRRLPNDISHKRIDDSDALTETDEQKKKKKGEASAVPELSLNAQFRAIKPSLSVLTYVQENLLGRRRDTEFQKAGYNIDLSVPLDNIPWSDSSERVRIEENMFRNKMTLSASAKVSSSFPPANAPEIAFAGRSNVGKSSLLNALTRRWGVAPTSDKPGLTQTINFFELGPKLSLVDLPGYGFAYAKEEVKDAWEELVKEYVTTRVGLKRVCLLIDTKWGMKPRDYELIYLMERAQTNYQVVLTKTDVVLPIDVARRATQIEESLKHNKSVVQPVMMVSSKTGAGIRSMRTVLRKIARFAKL